MTHHEEGAEVHPPEDDEAMYCMTHHEEGPEVHPPENDEAVYDSP
jgi:hypothetical protein